MPGAARARVVTPRAGTAPVHFRKYPRERSLRERDGGDVTDMVTSVKRIVSGKETRFESRPRAGLNGLPSPFTPKVAFGGYCCKSRKLQRHEFFAKTRGGRRLLIRIPSIALPKSPVSLTRGDMSPHIFTPKTRLQPAEFLITCAKRLLQQYRTRSGHLEWIESQTRPTGMPSSPRL